MVAVSVFTVSSLGASINITRHCNMYTIRMHLNYMYVHAESFRFKVIVRADGYVWADGYAWVQCSIRMPHFFLFLEVVAYHFLVQYSRNTHLCVGASSCSTHKYVQLSLPGGALPKSMIIQLQFTAHVV